MNIVFEIADRLRSLQRDLPQLMTEVIEENATLIEDKVIGQLQKGQRGDGEFLPDYSPASVLKYGKEPGPIKLFDTGAFYSRIKATVRGNSIFDIDNDDSKVGMLTKRFGEEVLDLTDDNLQDVIDDILQPGLIEKANVYLFQ